MSRDRHEIFIFNHTKKDNQHKHRNIWRPPVHKRWIDDLQQFCGASPSVPPLPDLMLHHSSATHLHIWNLQFWASLQQPQCLLPNFVDSKCQVLSYSAVQKSGYILIHPYMSMMLLYTYIKNANFHLITPMWSKRSTIQSPLVELSILGSPFNHEAVQLISKYIHEIGEKTPEEHLKD